MRKAGNTSVGFYQWKKVANLLAPEVKNIQLARAYTIIVLSVDAKKSVICQPLGNKSKFWVIRREFWLFNANQNTPNQLKNRFIDPNFEKTKSKLPHSVNCWFIKLHWILGFPVIRIEKFPDVCLEQNKKMGCRPGATTSPHGVQQQPMDQHTHLPFFPS